MPYRRSSFRRLAALLAAASLALAACDDDGVGPELGLVGERYRLVRVNEEPLPATLWREADGRSAVLLAQELAFQPLGKVRVARSIRVTDALGVATDEPASWVSEYRVRDGRIEIGSFTPCPPNALCVANDVGTLQPDALVIESGWYAIADGPARLRYERVPEGSGPDLP